MNRFPHTDEIVRSAACALLVVGVLAAVASIPDADRSEAVALATQALAKTMRPPG